MNEYNRTRAKILGVLIRDARLHAGRTVADCARVLGSTPEAFTAVERGIENLSLPDLEVLAMYLGVPLDHFWGDKTLGAPHRINYDDILIERQRAVGQALTAAREAVERSAADAAKELEVDVETIEAYEAGTTAVPLFHLEKLGRYYGHSLQHFIDHEYPPFRTHEDVQRIKTRFDALDPEMKAFVVEPINESYLDIALRLSRMDVNALRSVAENILNITF